MLCMSLLADWMAEEKEHFGTGFLLLLHAHKYLYTHLLMEIITTQS